MLSMEMDKNGNFSNDMSKKDLLDSSYASSLFGENEMGEASSSRVGDQYQADIPSLITESECLEYTKNPIEEENRAGLPYNFLMGLPITLTLIGWEDENINEEKTDSSCDLNNAKHKFDPSDSATNQFRGCLVPGSSGDSWSDIEKSSFLLGLYIFYKEFFQVKRFVESKSMGDILSFYYGKFYRCDEYRRWSECQKSRSRRCVYGQRIFSGLRQQELLSRLFPHISEECQKALLEVSKTFGDGKISLEEYVSSLKAMVGLKNLVDAVGIGRGKQDLTGTALEFSKSNQVIIRPEIPMGKACSTLTPGEIIKFLTGDYRLSKARSNDLFWEAVWPRLLAKGWHSEQPSGYNYAANSKHALVFLMPGVNKFSRRRLVKGDHYFDSVTDVLSKVASEPGILELDSIDNEVNNEETKLEEDDLPERQRHCYLQPRNPSRGIDTDGMKFTVVDTSLADAKKFKVRELKSLPVEISRKSTERSHSDEDNYCELSTDESDSIYTLSPDQERNNGKPRETQSDRGKLLEREDLEIGTSVHDFAVNGSDSMNQPGKNSKKHNIAPTKLSRRVKEDNLGHSAPVGKRRRRLTACSNVETNQGMSNLIHPILEQDMPVCFSDTPHFTENNLSHVSSFQSKFLSNTSSSRGSSVESIEEHPSEEPQPSMPFDLNLPPEEQDGPTRMDQNESGRQKDLVGATNSEEQLNLNLRRQSTRNRPPTARALEALANGFLTINSRRKGKEDNVRANSRSRSSRHSRGEVGATEFAEGNPSTVEEVNDLCDGGDSDMFRDYQLFPKENGTKISGA